MGDADLRLHAFVSAFHNNAPIRPRACRGELRQGGRCLRGGPVRVPESSAPQPPGARPDRPSCSAYGSIPPTLSRAGSRRPFVFGDSVPARMRAGISHRRGHGAHDIARRRIQRREMAAAPSTGPGLALLPACTSTAASSIPPLASSPAEIMKLRVEPAHSPSFNHRRTTLW